MEQLFSKLDTLQSAINEIKMKDNQIIKENELLKEEIKNIKIELSHLKDIVNKLNNKDNLIQEVLPNEQTIPKKPKLKNKTIINNEQQSPFKEPSNIQSPNTTITGIKKNIDIFGLVFPDKKTKILIYSPIELSDERIACGSYDGSIIVCSVNLITNQWKRDFKKEKAHNDSVISLCELNDNKLVSASYECNINIWFILPNDLLLLKHSNMKTVLLK